MSSKLIVNLNNIKSNILYMKSNFKKDVMITAMIKANAYGAGSISVAKYLEENNLCEYFGVSSVEEGIALRENNISKDIIIFTQILKEDIKKIFNYNFIPSVSSLEILKNLDILANKKGIMQKVHIKFDTGMGRLGFSKEDVKEVANLIKTTKNIIYEGIYTHFAASDTDASYTKFQEVSFENIIEEFKENDIEFNIIHSSNSAGVITSKNSKCNMVRIGIAMYGYLPDINLKDKMNLKPALKLISPICEIRKIKKGCSISYGRTYIAKEDMLVGILQIGYADGLSRGLSNKINVIINGTEAPIVGNICMDMCMIDITGINYVNVGDYVTIFEDEESVDNQAKILSTINYEIISRIGSRVKREYIDK